MDNALTLKGGLFAGALVAGVSAGVAYGVRRSTTSASLKDTEARIVALEMAKLATEGGK